MRMLRRNNEKEKVRKGSYMYLKKEGRICVENIFREKRVRQEVVENYLVDLSISYVGRSCEEDAVEEDAWCVCTGCVFEIQPSVEFLYRSQEDAFTRAKDSISVLTIHYEILNSFFLNTRVIYM